MSVAYKIGQKESNPVFLPDSPEKVSWLMRKLFCNKNIFQIIYLNYNFCIILVYLIGAFFQKNYCLLENSLIVVSLTSYHILNYLCKSKKST